MKRSISAADIPSSVYRLQLNGDFPLKKAILILPYLKELGVEGVYCSPFFQAYSKHGYDVTNPNRLNPKIGTMEEYKEFCKALKKNGLKQIVDVVPNHMGIKGGQNPWWQDVLEHGPYSEYASFFDINWSPEKKELQDRVLLPILGNTYGKVLENQEIQLNFQKGEFLMHYADFPLPVAPHTYPLILECDIENLKNSYDEKHPDWNEYQAVIELYRFFPLSFQERIQKKEEGKKRLQTLVEKSSKIKRHLHHILSLFHGRKRSPRSFDLLDRLLEGQFYRLAYWRVANHEINYRRFFNIHELVSIRIEEESVLESHHRWLFELLKEGGIHGLRIDHPDGLYDPVSYFERLRKQFPIFTVVEKILDRKEALPETWQVEGTVGYEYLNLLNGLFIRQDHEKAFTEIYEEFLGHPLDFDEILYNSKKLFTNYEMVSEVEALGLKLDRLSETNREYRDFTRHDLTKALAEVIACFPVYRTYIGPTGKVSKRDKLYISIAIEKAKVKAKDLDISIFDFVEKLMLGGLRTKKEEQERYREFVLRFQQLTGPMMAKGLEDTSFYVYNRFVSLNEVGGDPPHFGHSIGEFHRHNQNKLKKWPYGFLSTSTHDTKRSEDIRMRLNVLSEIPEMWRLEVKKWALVNSKYKKESPTANTEYYIYQTLIGVWPKGGFRKGGYHPFCERVWAILLKSMREAKQETSWMYPNEAYEEEVKAFFFAILSEEKSNNFLKLFTTFLKQIDRYGGWNSLSQIAIKMGSPGVVDIYQGNEILTYRLVDPDNRVEIDFEVRKKMLASVKSRTPAKLFTSHDLGEVKLYIHYKVLHFRKKHHDLFLDGEYLPLRSRGGRKEHVIAFMRKINGKFLIVVAGRFFSRLASADWDVPLGIHAWGDTEILLPSEFKNKTLHDLFIDKKRDVINRGNYTYLRVADILKDLPVSYLTNVGTAP